MGRPGTNNGGGPRWATMPRGKCPLCGLVKPVGITQGRENGFICRNPTKCRVRAAKKKANGAAEAAKKTS